MLAALASPQIAAADGSDGPAPPDAVEVFERQEDLGLRVTLSWNHRDDCFGYRVYRSENENGPYENIGGVSGATMSVFPFFLDDTVSGGVTYYYRVSAMDEQWREGPPGAPVRARFEKYYRASAAGKRIVVSLADQHVYCLEDDVIVNILRCSTGSIGPTPTGNYRIYAHRRWVSNCEYWMDWKFNYGMHSWPRYSDGYRDFEESLGVRPRSHGCIRLHPLEAYWPYNWAPDGTPLTIISGSYGGLPLKGANCSSGATEPSETWYFAEGFTGADFTEFLLLFNPGTDPVDALATYYPEGYPPVTESYHLEPGARHTVSVNGVAGIPPSMGHSIEVEATGGIVAQQSEYFNFGGKRGGHTALGVTEPSEQWYFGEGYTGEQYYTYLLLFNPGYKRADVSVIYYGEGMAPYLHEFSMPPKSRGTTLVNALPGLQGRSFAIGVNSTEPLVAARTAYFDFARHPNGVNGGEAAPGLSELSTTWYLAEGCTGHFFDEYISVLNPQSEPATFNVEFLTASMGPVVHQFQVAPYSRGTISVDGIPGLQSVDTAAIITSDKEIAVERVMYYAKDSRRGGHLSTGVSEAATDWYFAEGYTAGTFDEYILLMNPGGEPATATLLFHLENGSTVGAQYLVNPKARVTVPVDSIPGLTWTASSLEAHSDRPIVAEQAQYFCIPR